MHHTALTPKPLLLLLDPLIFTQLLFKNFTSPVHTETKQAWLICADLSALDNREDKTHEMFTSEYTAE